jgi:hypothetical protein
LVAVGKVPPFSAVIFSGRGLWVLWCLVDARNPTDPDGRRVIQKPNGKRRIHRPHTAVLATAGTVSLWKALQRRLIAAMPAQLHADKRTNPARLGPPPGTWRTSVGRPVEWLWSGDTPGFVRGYTQQQIAEFFGVDWRTFLDDAAPSSAAPRRLVGAARAAAIEYERTVRPMLPGDYQPRAHVPPEVRASCQSGNAAVVRGQLLDVEMILAGRGGGLDEGLRDDGAHVLASLLWRSKWPEPEIYARLHEYADRCRPPFPHAEVDKTTASARYRSTLKHWKHTSIRDRLQLTDAEWADCRYLRDTSENTRKKPAPAERHARIREIHTAMGGQLPPFRQLAAMLKAEGHSSSLGTLTTDCRTLGIPVQWGRPTRPSVLAM